jgi:peptide deformylase
LRLKIVQAGDPVLREATRPLTAGEIASGETQRLIHDMQETMYDAPGVGLAAPQVGIPLQLAVIEDREELLKNVPTAELLEKERKPVPLYVVINPRIVVTGGEKVEFHEGCLSLAGFSAVVPRVRTIQVQCLNERGEAKVIDASGWFARILQHEIDHLQGILYIDRMHSRTFTTLENWNRYVKAKPTR